MPGDVQRTDDRLATFVISFPARTDALAGARADFTEWLSSCTIGEEARSELGIVFSELGANAVTASPSPTGEVLTRASWDGIDLELEVFNPTSGARRTAIRWDLEDPLRSGGRGLMLVRSFVDEVEIGSDDGGNLVVRCRRRG